MILSYWYDFNATIQASQSSHFFLLGLVETIVSSANLQVQMARQVFCGYVVHGISLDKDIWFFFKTYLPIR
jgi:hypothetical protein